MRLGDDVDQDRSARAIIEAVTKTALPLFGPAFSVREASELSGASRDACRWLLQNSWARSVESPAEHLTAMEVVLLAAAQHFRLHGLARHEFFVLLRHDRRPTGSFVITLESRHRPLVPAVRAGTPADVPREPVGRLVYDARPLLLATGVLDVPDRLPPLPSARRTVPEPQQPTSSGRQVPLFGPHQDELF